jgi:hypothetical protein
MQQIRCFLSVFYSITFTELSSMQTWLIASQCLCAIVCREIDTHKWPCTQTQGISRQTVSSKYIATWKSANTQHTQTWEWTCWASFSARVGHTKVYSRSPCRQEICRNVPKQRPISKFQSAAWL